MILLRLASPRETMTGMRQPRRPVTVAVIAVAVAATLAGISGSLWVAAADRESPIDVAFNAAVVLAFVIVGAVVTGARPDNRIGWLMLAAGATWALGNAGTDIAHHGLVADPGSVVGVSTFAIGGAAVRSIGWYLVTLAVPTYFPDGRLAGPRWRWLSRLLVVIMICSVIDPLTDKQGDLGNAGDWTNPLAPPHPWDLVSAAAFLGHVPVSVVATIGVLFQLRARWRGGDALRRQQLKLFLGAAVLPVIAAPIGIWSDAGSWIFQVTAIPLPFAIGFAVLSRGLYDLRTATNRTLVWVTLSAVVAGLYALVIVGLGSEFGTHKAAWLAWVAAAVIAVSFAPLRDLLQRGVNRLTYGRWDEPYDVLAALGQRLEATADVDRLLADVVTELRGLGLDDVAITDVGGQVTAGEPNAGAIEHPLSAFGKLVGTLRYRQPMNPLRARDRQLLDDLAGHLGGVLHAHQLTLDLQRALEHQVLAREEERRRLRRDLHDGLGPALAGHLLRLDLLATRVADDAVVRAEIDALRGELRGTVAEVRRVVEGLRPPVLDELGLEGALAQVLERLTAGTTTVVDLDVGELPPLSAAIEVAAFRIVTEAVTNVVRHAGATACQVSIAAHDGLLLVTVGDDGRGVHVSQGAVGNGLQTMRERAEELRGRMRVTSNGGTTVVVELPLPPNARLAPRTSVRAVPT